MFYILLLLQIANNRRLKWNPEHVEITIDNQCYFGSPEEFKYLTQLYNVTPHQSKNCLRIHHFWSISETFQYGNWCGKGYGGFNNQCKDECLKNPYEPTEKCVQCNPPRDWVDQQCMYHDFCMTRFESYHIGYGQACSDEINFGNPFPSPCDCAYNLTEHLKYNYLIENCGIDLECQLNGQIIYNFFDSDLLKCSCSYQQCNNNTIDSDGNFISTADPVDCWNTTACVNVEQCSALNGE